jgi:hypothetical protein
MNTRKTIKASPIGKKRKKKKRATCWKRERAIDKRKPGIFAPVGELRQILQEATLSVRQRTKYSRIVDLLCLNEAQKLRQKKKKEHPSIKS